MSNDLLKRLSQISSSASSSLPDAVKAKISLDTARTVLRALDQEQCKLGGHIYVKGKGSRKSYCREKAKSKADKKEALALIRALDEESCKAGNHTYVKVKKGSKKGTEYCRLKSKKSRKSKKSSPKKVARKSAAKKSRKSSAKKSSRIIKKDCKSPKSWIKRSSRARGYCRK
jgi:hypothetical protein